MKNRFLWILAFSALILAGCSSKDEPTPPTPSGGDSAEVAYAPDLDYGIHAWAGETADDAASDVAGTDADIYYEANTFTNVVTVTYSGDGASVESNNSYIHTYVSGAYVTVDMQSSSVSNVELVLKGHSDDGSLKIYGNKKFKLTLDGVELTSKRGPAINNQCKKKMFLNVTDGTVNSLVDSESYTDDTFYLSGSSAADEDRKGALFSEANVVVSGHGTLSVSGRYRHAIAVDGYFVMRPGVTLVIPEAAKNGLQVKGDATDGIGVEIRGGLLYAALSSPAGKCVKSDMDVKISGGKLCLNASGDAIYDDVDKDTSSPCTLKTDGSIRISGGQHVFKSTGSGGKGLNATGAISLSGGDVTVITSGEKYVYSTTLTSAPKGVKADGDISVSGGKMVVAVVGNSDGAVGLESKQRFSMTDGEAYVYAYEDAVNTTAGVSVSGGKLYMLSVSKDGLDTDGDLTVSGGVVAAFSAAEPKCGFSVNESSLFNISGGTLIAAGGQLKSLPSVDGQRYLEATGITLSQYSLVALLDNSGSPILTVKMPRSLSKGSLFFSSPSLEKGSAYTLSALGTLSSYSSMWNDIYEGGSWSGGDSIASF